MDTRFDLFRQRSARLRLQQSRQLAGGRATKHEIVDITISGVKTAAEKLGGVQTNLGLGLDQFQQVPPIYKVQLAGSGCFGGRFIAQAGDRSAKTEGFAGFGGFEHENLAFARRGRKIHSARTQDKHAARALSLDEQNCTGRQSASVADQFQRLQSGLRKTTRKTGTGVGALQAVIDDFEPIRSVHVILRGEEERFGLPGKVEAAANTAQMVGAGQPGTGVSAGIAVGALGRGDQLPGCARFWENYNRGVARGWESKSVEAQQAEAGEQSSPRRPKMSRVEAALFREKESLRLSREKVLQEMEASSNPRHRKLLQDALADLDQKLGKLRD